MTLHDNYTIIVESGYDEAANVKSAPIPHPAYSSLESLSRSGHHLTIDEKMEYAGMECAFMGGKVRTELLRQLNFTAGEAQGNPLFWIAYYETKERSGVLNEKEKIRFEIYKKKESIRRLKLLNGIISASGLTYPLSADDVEKIAVIQNEVRTFKILRLEFFPMIYCDLETYLHVALQRVPDKGSVEPAVAKGVMPFQREELRMLIHNVLEPIVDEIKDHFISNKGEIFHRSGERGVYFNGNYYSLDIDVSGKILSFYKI